ncbi:hypothetical protein OHD62_17450 [Mesorhizobium sp. YC-39]|uniref:hypothetical protein n=1 Tax=unclassified Mesorhizobium TaxID=325217 RepID=UPI0021E8140B|nr:MULTISPECIES: hypothetical protein [unclassified Mesorhizobium]MCV3209630.1 hypothetical protein [Mesorhizobium sp. YC-2]MCV3230160.1 hypothetical protein [Mesorhizobium sp. YC-39]
MTHLLAAGDFTDRLVPRYPTAPSQETRPAAEAETLPASAAFSHFTESCPVSPPVDGQDLTAPAPPAKECAGAVSVSRISDAIHLPDHAMVLVRAISAYENCSNEHAVMLALASYGKSIGAGPLARAIFDLSDEGGP